MSVRADFLILIMCVLYNHSLTLSSQPRTQMTVRSSAPCSLSLGPLSYMLESADITATLLLR